jgi:hypothetical protein
VENGKGLASDPVELEVERSTAGVADRLTRLPSCFEKRGPTAGRSRRSFLGGAVAALLCTAMAGVVVPASDAVSSASTFTRGTRVGQATMIIGQATMISSLAVRSQSRATISAPVQAGAKKTAVNYAALGDSYSSGEGLGSSSSTYIGKSGKDGCHRDVHAYPELVASKQALRASSFQFVACSGAVTGSPIDGPVPTDGPGTGSLLSGRDGEQKQLLALSPATTEVSLTIGGNDVGFVDVVASCMSGYVKLGPLSVTGESMAGASKCAKAIQHAKKLLAGSSSELEQALMSVYRQILTKAPAARLAVLNYPQLLTTATVSGFCPLTGGVRLAFPVGPIGIGATFYLGFTADQVATFDALEQSVNAAIDQAVTTVAGQAKYSGRIRLVDVNSATTRGAQPCSTKTMARADINGVLAAPGAGISNLFDCVKHGFKCPNGKIMDFFGSGSLHPKSDGHVIMANSVEAAFSAPRSPSITSYTSPSIDEPAEITDGPDGALWFTNWGNNSIGRITTSGKVTSYTSPSIDDPYGITEGPDGALWFINSGNGSIGRITVPG